MKTRTLSRVVSLVRPWLPKTLRPYRVLSGPLRGARIVTSWHDYPAGIAGITERPLLNWFQKYVETGSTWLDIGAHYGYTAVALSRLVGSNGRVFAFEPMTTTARCISETRKLNSLDQLTVVPNGLGCPQTHITTSLPSVRGMADGTLKADEYTPNSAIKIARLDWQWPRLNANNPSVQGVKIDVQGMELEVLRGMREMLIDQKPVLAIELHRGVDRRQFIEFLVAVGYSPDAMPIDATSVHGHEILMDDCSYAFFRAFPRMEAGS